MSKSMMRTFRTHKGEWWRPFQYYPGGAPSSVFSYSAKEKDSLLYSEGHQVSQLGKSDQDIGGPFVVNKQMYHESAAQVLINRSSTVPPSGENTHVYRGPLYCWKAEIGVNDYPSVIISTAAEMAALGTTAIARVIPTNPLSGAAVFLGELRQGIPRLCGSDFFLGRSARARSAGSEYLNVEFGWKPLVNDVRKFSRTVTDSNEIMRQYERNSGKRVKRRFTFPIETETSVTVQKSSEGTDTRPSPVLDVQMFRSGDNGVRTLTVTKERRVWFSGCFTYYLPPYVTEGSNFIRYEQLANKLYGTRLTPEVLWDLTPWSWAADWFGNTGDLLHNVSAFQNDGLVMPYGYLMESKKETRRWESTGNWCKTTAFSNLHLTQTLETVTKQRVKASPYGFGINVDSLSLRQNAILAALGLNKGRGQK